MKKRLLLIVMTLAMGTAAAQSYKTIELKPITQSGWKYFYDMKKVRSPLALEVPLLAADDEEVTRHLKGFRSYQTAATLVVIIPAVYVLTMSRHQHTDANTFWWIFGGSLAASLGLEALAHVQLGKSIDKYNMIIMRPSGSSLGLELTWRFL